MRAWLLGATLAIIGALVFYYAITFLTLADLDYVMFFSTGLVLLVIGIAILGVHARQWVEDH